MSHMNYYIFGELLLNIAQLSTARQDFLWLLFSLGAALASFGKVLARSTIFTRVFWEKSTEIKNEVLSSPKRRTSAPFRPQNFSNNSSNFVAVSKLNFQFLFQQTLNIYAIVMHKFDEFFVGIMDFIHMCDSSRIVRLDLQDGARSGCKGAFPFADFIHVCDSR